MLASSLSLLLLLASEQEEGHWPFSMKGVEQGVVGQLTPFDVVVVMLEVVEILVVVLSRRREDKIQASSLGMHLHKFVRGLG